MKDRISFILLLVICACSSVLGAHAQDSDYVRHEILGGTATILLPASGFESSINHDSTRFEMSALWRGHEFVVAYWHIGEGVDAEQLLRTVAKEHIDQTPGNATVNYDFVEGACHAGVEMTIDMWTAATKPMGLRYSTVRLYIINEYFLSLSIKGLGQTVENEVAALFFDSLKVKEGAAADCNRPGQTTQ